jgi:uncharacterized protein with von Willebrand factor type A (vWA) domain
MGKEKLSTPSERQSRHVWQRRSKPQDLHRLLKKLTKSGGEILPVRIRRLSYDKQQRSATRQEKRKRSV